MRDANPRLTPEQARHLTVHGAYRDEDGTYPWKFDNYVRAASPYLFNMRDAQRAVEPDHLPDAAGARHRVVGIRPAKRTAAPRPFTSYRLVNIERAGHWVHHDQLEEFLQVTREFLAE